MAVVVAVAVSFAVVVVFKFKFISISVGIYDEKVYISYFFQEYFFVLCLLFLSKNTIASTIFALLYTIPWFCFHDHSGRVRVIVIPSLKKNLRIPSI